MTALGTSLMVLGVAFLFSPNFPRRFLLER
jgi:hypothetical protein